jgi:hypothetical protein
MRSAERVATIEPLPTATVFVRRAVGSVEVQIELMVFRSVAQILKPGADGVVCGRGRNPTLSRGRAFRSL